MQGLSRGSRAIRFFLTAASLAAVSLVGGCGGSGDDSDGGSSAGLTDSDALAQICAAPRPAGTVDPLTGRAYNDVQGTLADEKSFVRSWTDETYLWYQDVRALPAATLDAGGYSTPVAYFAALKSPLTTPSGRAKDEFHYALDTPSYIASSQSGQSYGYGALIALIAASPPRSAVVALVDPGTPAAAAGIARGAEIITVDGVDFANGSDVAALNEGLFPSRTGTHTLTIRDSGATATRVVTLAAQVVTEVPVQNVKTLPAPNGSVGYMLFTDHIATSEAELVAGIKTLQTAGISDLVLDLRYNGGGYLDIAAELAYMIAGPTNTAAKFFERLSFNDRNPFGYSTAEATTDFLSTGQGFSVGDGTPLPTLGLGRVFVLTSADTCSASEAIVNGLRGAGVTVNLIGGSTCGKPYGFFPRDNCNTTYFAIQFAAVNDLGFGDYADGFAPTCPVADDYAHALGDPAEAQLETALRLRSTGACAPVLTAKASAQAAGLRAPSKTPVLSRTLFQQNRIYRSR